MCGGAALLRVPTSTRTSGETRSSSSKTKYQSESDAKPSTGDSSSNAARQNDAKESSGLVERQSSHDTFFAVALAHCEQSTVLPHPAGATNIVNAPRTAASSRAT